MFRPPTQHKETQIETALDNPERAAYLSLLASVIKCGARAVPGVGLDPDERLSDIASALGQDSAGQARIVSLEATNHEVRDLLAAWAERAFERHQTNEREIAEIVTAMRNAVDSLTAHNERYRAEVGDLTVRLHSITAMDDLTQVRQTIVDSANSLAACLEHATEASHRSLKRLKAEMDNYRACLSDTVKLSVLDPLTGLTNRRGFEERLEFHIESGNRFSLILIDLNGFKEVNDRLGHIAGDEALKSVAARLCREFPLADLVARWGGDEFVVIVTCGERDAKAHIGRVRRDPIGECRAVRDGHAVTVLINAAFGVVEWDGAETGTALLNRVDRCMYEQKRLRAFPA